MPTSPPSDRTHLLRDHGVQVTAQRLAVLQAVSEHPHCSATDINAAVRAEIGAISLQAVYDTLSTLAEKGIIRRIQPAGSPARYEARVGDNHHHVICRSCGRMDDTLCASGTAPCLPPPEDCGFEIDEAEVIFWGRCPDCLGGPDASQRHRPAMMRTEQENRAGSRSDSHRSVRATIHH